MIHYDFVHRTPVGEVLIAASDRGLCAVILGRQSARTKVKKLAGMFPGDALKREASRLERYKRQIEEFFAGKRKRFSIPVDLAAIKSPFRRKALKQAQKIPFGRTSTYGEIAARCGNPRAARAVGGAMGSNPVPIVIPCHRVVASSGGLGGFSCGIGVKRVLLAIEGVRSNRTRLAD
jgi:methylated-DNA-[protein]-cysteine S-methyltransferase